MFSIINNGFENGERTEGTVIADYPNMLPIIAVAIPQPAHTKLARILQEL